MELIGQARSSSAGGCKLARSLSRMQARPPKPSPTACARSWRSPARSYLRKPLLQPTSNLLPNCLQPCACMRLHRMRTPTQRTQRPLLPLCASMAARHTAQPAHLHCAQPALYFTPSAASSNSHPPSLSSLSLSPSPSPSPSPSLSPPSRLPRSPPRSPPAEGAPLLPARARCGRAVLQDPAALRYLSGPCGSRCGADLRKARGSVLQKLLLAGARERELLTAWPWMGPQGLGAGLPAKWGSGLAVCVQENR
jgi:hypothetical protein